jgi:hypothetical protein
MTRSLGGNCWGVPAVKNAPTYAWIALASGEIAITLGDDCI